MAYELFARLIDMSITATVVIIAVLIARCFMGRLPKRYSYILWVIVAVRLLCPVGFSSSFSVFNLVGEHKVSLTEFQGETALERGEGQKADQKGEETDDPSSEEGKAGTVVSRRSDAQGNYADEEQADIERHTKSADFAAEKRKSNGEIRAVDSFVKYGTVAWISIGMILVIWNFLLMTLMRKRVSRAIRLRENIYECDNIPTPFVMGFARPRIYIPFRLEKEEQAYIIRHEQHHVARKDNVVKLIAFLITCAYWFHPLVWLSYFLMIRDMEMSCDEYVLQKSGRDIREDYSRSLLGFATNQRNMGVGLIAFGESGARRRVKHIMKFKKCGKWIGMIAVGVVLAVGAACLTDARNGDHENKIANNGSQSQDIASSVNKDQFAVVAKANISEYQLEIQCVPGKKAEKKSASGYYEGDSLVIQTSRNDEIIDRRDVTFAKDEKMYFPVDGFELRVSDYDGDGKKNDFALGQGQTPDPMLGNYMRYRFFGVDEDGTVVVYHTSTEDGVSIGTIPGEYSPLFERRNGELKYTGLREDGGGVEETSTSIARYISVDDVRKTKQEPMNSIMKSIEKNMPSGVVKELQDKGVWHVSWGEGNEIQYNLANGENWDDITLRLDFIYKGDQLVNYVSKEYGFTDGMKKSDGGDWFAKLTDFARDFAGVESKYVDDSIEDFRMMKKKYANKYNIIGNAEIPEKWDDGNHAFYEDENGATYLMDTRINMVVGYVRAGMEDDA